MSREVVVAVSSRRVGDLLEAAALRATAPPWPADLQWTWAQGDFRLAGVPGRRNAVRTICGKTLCSNCHVPGLLMRSLDQNLPCQPAAHPVTLPTSRKSNVSWHSKFRLPRKHHGVRCCVDSGVVASLCGGRLYTSPHSNQVVAAAKVCGLADESPSVKSLRLHIADKDFSFKAGQWVDFFIPGVSEVGGFSICSSPSLLEQERMIELAVKYTKHPPALWIHNKCTLGSEVAVRVGGEFFFDPQPTDALRSLVLIAGGVGINPLLSILRHSADLHRARADGGHGYAMGPVRLLYSAKDSRELLFKKTILDIVNEFPGKITCSFHVTKQTTQISAELKPYITEGRITEEEIRDHVSRDALFYLCGPPPMTDFFSKQLESSHVPREHICYEKWW